MSQELLPLYETLRYVVSEAREPHFCQFIKDERKCLSVSLIWLRKKGRPMCVSNLGSHMLPIYLPFSSCKVRP